MKKINLDAIESMELFLFLKDETQADVPHIQCFSKQAAKDASVSTFFNNCILPNFTCKNTYV